jgi:exodeoxyribonuclease-5
MRANWEEQSRRVEGRPDAEEQSVALITIHAAKGLEWPVVIPINMTGAPKSESGLMHDRRSGEFSIPVLDIEPAGYAAIKSWNEIELARERVRLWYVAAARARDLLVLPRHFAKVSDKSWAKIVDLGLTTLSAINPADLGAEMFPPISSTENTQTDALFTDEAKKIADTAITIRWHRPSLHEADAPPSEPLPVFSEPESAETDAAALEVTGSATRGTILHKLMEEVLTGETQDSILDLERRATELLTQLGREASSDPKFGISPTELASTIDQTLNLPEVVALRPRLIPEQTVFGHEGTVTAETLVSGIADAIGCNENGKIEIVVDWKSDVEVNSTKYAAYKAQLGAYREQTDAKEALFGIHDAGCSSKTIISIAMMHPAGHNGDS